LRDIYVWAYHTDFGTLCRHAGFDKGAGLSYPAGDSQGQAGWHVAISFSSLPDLATKFKGGIKMPPEFCGNRWQDCDGPIARGEVVRLALMMHGDQGGKLAINGKNRLPVLTADNVADFHDDLHNIGLFTREAGTTILLMGCLAGQGPEGTRLLKTLAKVWPGRRIVGFSTTGYRHPGAMKRPGEACELPGMRDTDATAELYANPYRFDKLWSDFAKMPWASETSIHAKVVVNDKIERCPADELCEAPPRPTPKPDVRQKSRSAGHR
jgi:hypothetical protein